MKLSTGYGGPQNHKQRLAGQRNWHILQLRGAIGALKSLAYQTGCTTDYIDEVDHTLSEAIDREWNQQKTKLAEQEAEHGTSL